MLYSGRQKGISCVFRYSTYSVATARISHQRSPRSQPLLGGFGGYITSQSITFIDAAGSRAQYTVSERDHRNEYHWSTDYGDHGLAPSFAQAQDQARAVLKASMAASRKSDRA